MTRKALLLVLAWALPLSAADGLELVDVFTAGTEGYHTYRIPALAVTRSGTLLAFCEGRKTSREDLGDNDLMLKRSTDGGRTWPVYPGSSAYTAIEVLKDGRIVVLFERDGYKKLTLARFTPEWIESK